MENEKEEMYWGRLLVLSLGFLLCPCGSHREAAKIDVFGGGVVL